MIQQFILLNFSVFIIFVEQDFCIILVLGSKHLDCFNTTGSVYDSNNTKDLSCLTSSNIVEKYFSIYFLKIISMIDSSSFLIKPDYSSFCSI